MLICGFSRVADAAINGLALSPPLGWSSWSSLQTNVDEESIKAVVQIQASTLKASGYVYVNVDAGWYVNPDTAVDPFGRWVADSTKFPGGMAALGDYVHSHGLRFGLYVTPGIPKRAVADNTPIEGTPHRASEIALTSQTELTFLGGTMYYIDYAARGAQEFVNSWANLFASWGVDYLKLDGVGTWNIPDVQAWAGALAQTGRPIHLELANTLDSAYDVIWRGYANGWRISADIEAYNGTTLTSWERVASRFAVAPKWLGAARFGGWNDLDSLDAGSQDSGLTPDERRTMVTLWALSASPLIVGDDLRRLDALGVRLLTNPEVIAVDQSGVVGAPLNTATPQQVWTALQPDGSYAVGLFNLSDSPAAATVLWTSLGFVGSGAIRDLWSRADVGTFPTGFSVPLGPHASVMLRVTPERPVQQRLASVATLDPGASLGSSPVCPGGQRARYVGFGSAVHFATVDVTTGGWYYLTINYMNGDAAPREALVTVTGYSFSMAFPGGGDWEGNLTNQGVATLIVLPPGRNTITLSNPAGWAPDFVGITVQPFTAPTSPPAYKLLSAFSGKLVDDSLGSTASGTPIVQWSDYAQANQQWEMVANGDGSYHIVNHVSGMALEAASLSTQPGLQLDQAPYAGGSNQHWRLVAAGNGSFVLVNQYSGLPAQATATFDGAGVAQWFPTGATDEQWVLVPVM
jgi:hypothetical protein